MRIGYARVSTLDQNLDLQIDALKEAGCEEIFTDKVSGVRDKRPGLDDCLKMLRPGDTLVLWKLDRLSRSLKMLVDQVSELNDRGVDFVSIKESIDTTSSTGKLIFHLFCALAEFERDIIRERTGAGLSAARARGRFGGRPKKVSDKDLVIMKALYNNTGVSVADIASRFNVSRVTVWRLMNNKGR